MLKPKFMLIFKSWDVTLELMMHRLIDK